MNYYRVVIDSRSSFLAGGLTYASARDIAIGSLVRVPLRKSIVEGIIISREEEPGEGIKEILEVIGHCPVLSGTHCKLLSWMCSYYLVSPRSALKVMLPSPPWHLLFKPSSIAALATDIDTKASIRGKNLQAILGLLRDGPLDTATLLTKTGVPASTIKKLVERGYIVVHETEETFVQPKIPLSLPQGVGKFGGSILEHPTSVVILATAPAEEEKLAEEVSAACLQEGKSTMILTPDIAHAERLGEALTKIFGDIVILLHSDESEARYREKWRELRQGNTPFIIVGTRTALFAPIEKLGAVVLLREHDWRWKNEQTPHYHARLTAEILGKFTGAKLVLCSPCPSLETLYHAKDREKTASSRYQFLALPDAEDRNIERPNVQVIDLGDIRFEGLFPLTYPLLEKLQQQKIAGKKSVLIINKLGIGSSLLCKDCRSTVNDPVTHLPLSIVKRNGKTVLLSRQTDAVFDVPEACAKCRGTNLRIVGAGTQKVEELLTTHLPNLRIARFDAETKEEQRGNPKDTSLTNIDVLIGTQSAAEFLQHPEVTFGAILVADLGLSIPAIRSSELVYQRISETLFQITKNVPTTIFVQAFRPKDAAIACAITGDREKFALHELRSRSDAQYPPITQAMRLIFRGTQAKDRAVFAFKQAQSASLTTWMKQEFSKGMWCVTLIGTPSVLRSIMQELRPKCSAIDIDPLDL